MTTSAYASTTPWGLFDLRPFLDTDLDLVHAWMNDPAVARFWELAGPRSRLEQHLQQQHRAGHSCPYVGLVDGVPMSYWEIYSVAQDPLAVHYPAEPGDTGVHLLLGPGELRGVGLGRRLIETVSASLLLGGHARRVVAEPDVRNVASVRAFERAGFRRVDTLELPDKTAALMVRPQETTRHGGCA